MTGRTERIAVVAPMPEELQALRKQLEPDDEDRSVRRALRKLPWAGAGRLAGKSVVLAVTGDGEARSRGGIEAVLETVAPKRLLALGVGGGLSPSLEVEDVVLAGEVRGPDGGALRADPETVSQLVGSTGLREALVVTRRHLALRAEDKLDLYEEHGRPDAAVVDLESWHYVQVAEEAGVPWTILRAVSDEASEDLPGFLNDCLDDGGSVDRGKVMRHAVFHPSVMPRLLEMKSRVEACSRRLAEAARSVLEVGT